MISHEPKMPLPTELENHFILQINAVPSVPASHMTNQPTCASLVYVIQNHEPA
jgi:hypothetical protein